MRQTLYIIILIFLFGIVQVEAKKTKKIPAQKKQAVSSSKTAKKLSKSNKKSVSSKKTKKDPKIKKTSLVSEKKPVASKNKSKSSSSKHKSKSVSHHKSKKKKKVYSLPPIPETKTNTPSDEMTYRDTDYVLTIKAKEFKQGNMAFMKLESLTPSSRLDTSKYQVRWRKKNISLISYNNYHIALLPIHPDEPQGIQYLEIEKTEPTKIITKKFPIQIEKTNFPERKMYSTKFKISRKSKGYSEETLAFINKCDSKKKEAFSSESDLMIDGKFAKPLNKIYITSPFYVKRFYRPNVARPHGGIDLRGRVGEPIYALQTGKVVIAERMFFEGIFTVIDHGNKMFSLYMHQSKIFVKEGEIVKKGTLIGEVGSTGMSTGPHLHLGLKVDEVIVNPLSVVDQDLF